MIKNVKLIGRCEKTLKQLNIFDDHSHLITFFIGDLVPYREKLPEAKNRSERVEKCVDYLNHLPLLEGIYSRECEQSVKFGKITAV